MGENAKPNSSSLPLYGAERPDEKLSRDFEKVQRHLRQRHLKIGHALTFEEYRSNVVPYEQLYTPGRTAYLDRENFEKYYLKELCVDSQDSPQRRVEIEKAWEEYLCGIMLSSDETLFKKHLNKDCYSSRVERKKAERRNRIKDRILAGFGLLTIFSPYAAAIMNNIAPLVQADHNLSLGNSPNLSNNTHVIDHAQEFPTITTDPLLLGGEVRISPDGTSGYCLPMEVKAGQTYTITVVHDANLQNVNSELWDTGCNPIIVSASEGRNSPFFPVPVLKVPGDKTEGRTTQSHLPASTKSTAFSFKAMEDATYSVVFEPPSGTSEEPIVVARDGDKILKVEISPGIKSDLAGQTRQLDIVSVSHQAGVTETVHFSLTGITTHPTDLTLEMGPNITITLPLTYKIPSLTQLQQGVPIRVNAVLPPLSGFSSRTRQGESVLTNRIYQVLLPLIVYNSDGRQPPSIDKHVAHAVIIHGMRNLGDELRPVIQAAALSSANLMASTGGRNMGDVTLISADPTTCGYSIVDKCISGRNSANDYSEIMGFIHDSVSQLKQGDLVHLLLEDHGADDGKFITTPNLRINPADFVTAIKSACPGCEVVLLNNACHSGYSVQLVNGPNGPQAIVGTSTTGENDAYVSTEWGDTWTQSLHYALQQGKTYKQALEFAKQTVNKVHPNPDHPENAQQPQLDANKDAVSDPTDWTIHSVLDEKEIDK